MQDMVVKQKNEYGVDRIGWCDVYKGIVILLVVTGHVTPKYNSIIYQFHMAAFFFVSGYVLKTKGSFFENVLKKFYQLMVPYYVINLVGISVFFIMDKMGILDIISTTEYDISFSRAVILLIQIKSVYCDWLGAMWFLPVLFISTVIALLMAKIFGESQLLLCSSALLFVFTINASGNGMISLGGRAQFFVMLGIVARKLHKENGQSGTFTLIKLVIILILWKICYSFGLNQTVDWPSHQFNGIIDMLLPLYGIASTVLMASLLYRVRCVKDIFTYIGRNSMGIMCFHFIGFKIAYLILIIFRKMNVDEFYMLTPLSQNNGAWGVVIVVTAVVFSITVWRFLNSFKMAKLAVGGNWDAVYAYINNTQIYKSLLSLNDLLAAVFNDVLSEVKFLFQRHKRGIVVLAVMLIMIMPVKRIVSYSKDKLVTFPYYGNQIEFVDGWLPQGAGENYRWIGQKSKFSTFLIDESELIFQGYIPENITNGSYVKIRINGNEVYSAEACANTVIDATVDISEYVKKYRTNEFEVETDAVRIPADNDMDKRVFSILVNNIEIK